MVLMVCKDCNLLLYELDEEPRPGAWFAVTKFKPANHFLPEPTHKTLMICPYCGNNPFITHNFGVQCLTIEGETIPDPFEVIY